MGKILRWVGIVLLGVTSAFTIMGGAGTTCVAVAAEKYEKFVGIEPYKWLYVIFVLATIAAGVMMARALVLLVRCKPNGYRDTIIALLAGIVIGTIHIIVSRSLRNGSSMPVDAVTYTAVLTLIVFLLFKISGVWALVDFTQAKPGENEKAGGAAAIISGLLAFNIQYLMASTHTLGGVNYGDAFHVSMTLTAFALVLLGCGVWLRAAWQVRTHRLSTRRRLIGDML